MKSYADIVLKAHNIHKYYKTGALSLHILKGINLEIKRGEFLIIMGESGSGKSTLMHVLGLLDRFDKGSLIIEGEPVEKLKPSDLAYFRGNKIGFVFQNFNLLAKYSVLDNVLLPAEYVKIPNAKNRALELLKLVGLEHRVYHKPNQLSGGQKQRVAIARALLADPAIILADEPTGNLDSSTGLTVMKLFKKLHSKGKTVVLITHNPKMRVWGNRVVYLQDGRIIKQEIVKN